VIADLALRVRELNRKAIGLSLLNLILWLGAILLLVVIEHWRH
jgi:hypothetical protein